MRRTLVGVTQGKAGEPGVPDLRPEYLRSLEGAGAVPMALPARPACDAGRVLDGLDGLLLSGGADVDPALYGQDPHPALRRIERERDEFELALVREALRRDRPVLAICRGQQVLNVAMGGTLHQDIPSEWELAAAHDAPGERWDRSHEIEVLAQSRLRAILGRDRVGVNSMHHQAVDRLGDGLTVAARSPVDGVVEALEAPAARFVLAVQWHPESFWNQPDSFQCLFNAHAEACRS